MPVRPPRRPQTSEASGVPLGKFPDTTTLPDGTAFLAMQLRSPAGTRNVGLNYTIALSMDTTNINYNGAIGDQSLSVWLDAGSAPLF